MSDSHSPVLSGVYVLANDRVVDWFTAFVTSYRTYNPRLPLRLIPFDESARRCEQFLNEHGGTIHGDERLFTRLERIGAALEMGKTPTGPRWFRRFAAFSGPFETFAYLDCRMLVLADIADFANAAEKHSVPLVHYDQAINQVYNEGSLRSRYCRDGLGHGFLSGLWASRKGLFSIEQMEEAGAALVEIRNQGNPRNTDQLFLNYLCDSLQVRACHFADFSSDLARSTWASERGSVYSDEEGSWRKWDFYGLDHGKKLPFLHWAGIRLHPSMPHFWLHRRFRRPKVSPWQRLTEAVIGQLGGIGRTIRGNRTVNTAYHRWVDG